MPYQSQDQAAYFNIHKKELEKKGVDVDEWNKESKGMKLPKKKKKAVKLPSRRMPDEAEPMDNPQEEAMEMQGAPGQLQKRKSKIDDYPTQY